MSRARKLFFIAAALLAACAAASPVFANKKDNTVRFAARLILQSADPYFVNGAIGATIADNVWDTLLYRDAKTGAYKGDLATAWRSIDDRTMELDLRQGVKFHNGAEFTADDVVYTLNFVAGPESKIVTTTAARWIDHAEKLGKYKVRIVAKEATPTFTANLAHSNLVIHPHAYYAKVGAKGMNEHPVGTGPFRVSEHALGKYIRLERNPDYFKGGPKAQPRIDKVEIRYIPDAQTRVAEAVAGGVDLVTDISRDQAEQLRGVRGLQIVSAESNVYSILRMNSLPSTPAVQLRDVRVRQAIMHAINRETIAKYLVGEDSRVLHAECHPSEFGCTDENVPHYAYDPAKARRLLAGAGYPNGFDVDIWAYRERNETEAIIGYLRAVGIRARLRFVEQATLTAARRSGRVALFNSTWGSFIFDAANSVSPFHEFAPDDMNQDPEIRDLLLRADAAMDTSVRKDSYAKALKLIGERAYVLPLYSLPYFFIAANGLDFKPTAEGKLKFYEMSWK